MLEAIRKRSAGIVVKALLGLLILSFAMWGVADVFSPGGSDQTLASVGDVSIQPEEVRRDYQREIDRLSSTFGTRIDVEQARMFGLGKAVVQRAVQRTLYDLGAAELGIIATDDLVRRDIRNFSGFKNAQGQFERARFNQLLQSNRLSEAGYVTLTRGDIVRGQYLSMVNTAPLTPKHLANALYAHRNEKRIAETVTFLFDAETGVGEPDAATLAEFHKENAQTYTAPEYRKLTFISLTAAEIAKEIAVSDDTVRQAYEDRMEEFSEPEKRDLLQIRFKEEAQARSAHDRLKTGDDFLKVAQELAGMDARATALGSMKKSELPPALATVAFNLEPQSFSEPVKSVIGWHILRLKGITPARQQTIEETGPELKKQIQAEQSIDSLYHLANRMEDELGGGSTLEEAALALNLPLTSQDEIDSTGRTPAGTKVSGVPTASFMETAFSTPEGQESNLIEAGDDGYFIVRVDAVTQPVLKPLDSVRADVTKAWKARQRRQMAETNGAAMIEQIKAGGDFNKLAAERGLTVTTTPAVGREGAANLPRLIMEGLFSAKLNETVAAAGTDGYVIARIKEIKPANPAADAEKVKAVSDQLTASIRNDLMSQLATGLQKEFPVSINSEAINSQF